MNLYVAVSLSSAVKSLLLRIVKVVAETGLAAAATAVGRGTVVLLGLGVANGSVLGWATAVSSPALTVANI